MTTPIRTRVNNETYQRLKNLPNLKARQSAIDDLRKSVAEGAFESFGAMIYTTGKIGTDLLSLLMEPVYIAPEENPVKPSKRKKKRQRENHRITG